MEAGVERIDSCENLGLGAQSLRSDAPLRRAFCERVGSKLVPDLERKAAAVQSRLGAMHEQATSSAHHSPVVFVGGSASQTDLIVPPVVVDAWPREAVRATLAEKQLQQFHGFT